MTTNRFRKSCSWSSDTDSYSGIRKYGIHKYVRQKNERMATVGQIAFIQQACTSSLTPGERWLWHSCQAYLSLAEGRAQEQQLTHSKSQVSPACKNLSAPNKPLILIFTLTKKSPIQQINVEQFGNTYLVNLNRLAAFCPLKIAMAEHPFSQLR